MTPEEDDIVIACADLIGRAKADEFKIGYLHDDVPADQARITVQDLRSPADAVMALAVRLLDGALCRCRKPVTLTAGKPGCRWTRQGARWEPGCDAPPITVTGQRGDYAAMRQAMGPANRAERRRQSRGKP
jgi:hypothetical protein